MGYIPGSQDKRCTTCNAGYDNNPKRIIRCGLCVYQDSGNTRWAPITVQATKLPKPPPKRL